MKISNGILTAAINPLGAEVYSLKGNDREYIWEGDEKHWAKRSPVLFPIVGTLKNNSYLHNGENYSLTRHGFARDNIFTVDAQTTGSITFLLKANNDTKVMYPFEFELQINYALNDTALEVTYTIKNNGRDAMPFSIGGHPAFALEKPIGSYSLKFERQDELMSRMLHNNLLTENAVAAPATNGILPLGYKLFENDALVFTEIESRAVELLENGKPLVKVKFEKMPHLGIWTKDKAPFICIEPWQGYADSIDSNGNLFEKDGMIILQPGGEYQTGYSIEILS